MPTPADFLPAIAADPAAALILADWLDEQGPDGIAAARRLRTRHSRCVRFQERVRAGLTPRHGPEWIGHEAGTLHCYCVRLVASLPSA